MSLNFIEYERKAPFLFPPSIEDWLPQGHLTCFVVEIVEQLDLRPLTEPYAGRRSQAHNRGMLVALLFYGYAAGISSSRKLRCSTYDSVPFRYIVANQHPALDTIPNFRKRFLKELSQLFVQFYLWRIRWGCSSCVVAVLTTAKLRQMDINIRSSAMNIHASWRPKLRPK